MIFVTSYLLGKDGVVAAPKNQEEIGRPHQFVYLHSVSQSKMVDEGGYDIPCFFGDYPEDNPEGVFPVTIVYKTEEVPGTMFIWKNNQVHGLVVENSDAAGIADAKKKYEEKTSCL